MNACQQAAELLRRAAFEAPSGRSGMAGNLRALAADFARAGRDHVTGDEMCPECDDDAQRCPVDDMARVLIGRS